MPSRSAPAVAVANLFADIADPTTLPPELHARVNGVGEILAGLELDSGIVRAGMAASLAATGHMSPEALGARLESSTAELMRQVLALPVLESYTGQADTPLAAGHAENLRKLLLAVVRDGRVILIRLAERLHDLRSAKQAAPERQRRLALTTREIYAPLANRLGIWQLKWELEDLAFRYLEPDPYRQVAGWLKDRRSEREAYLGAAADLLRAKLKEAGIAAEVAGRPKHIYSIWKKMQRKGLSMEEMYDLLALRVLVADVAGCYASLGVVHGLWRHIAKEFDDYIAAPKDNFYRSLHTAVLGPEARPLEIQIRTQEMHSHAEFGVASHWRYKEGVHYDPALETRIGWMRQLLAPGGDEDFIERFRTELVEDRVYVLTPKGAVFDLPRGATALDFAYYVHTDVGHRCRGARVNGRLTPISQVLEDGDQVEIQTHRTGEPSRDWLNPQYGYLTTPRARDKLRAYFRQQDRGQNVSYGREMLERELERLALRDFRHDRLLKHFDFPSLEELFAALGAGDLSSSQLAGALQRELAESRPALPLKPARNARRRSQPAAPVLLPGVSGDVLISMAKCCRPVPGEAIRGYVTQGHGISVHRKSCASLARPAARSPQRLTEVQWRNDGDYGQPVEIAVEGQDRRNLLNDIMALLADEQLRLMALDSRSDADPGLLHLKLTVGIAGLPQLSRLLNRLMQIPGVSRASRSL
ncbi:MAG TPA: bifunctional (p)ppGpp synthetase/guanosine-3',5'-bis(diphosphate) 3'-pyrophosphohydrolase [Gammaproteobacteria bacterium]|nr:bifunctional (p)ppGpp synthetase/guanosine-3',5'-bis(diphosphate) 3'-pyrophosphohydrolase [Gammaproteobacteria bacterium]